MPAQLTMTWPQYLRGECTYRGWKRRLGYREKEIVLVLLMRHPYTTPFELMVEILYPDPDKQPETVVETLQRFRDNLNKKLGGIIRSRGRQLYIAQ